MVIIGMFFCIIAIMIIYKRLTYMLLGKSARGIIIGYGNSFKSYKGTETYPYKVKYDYNNKEYVAYSLETVTVSYGDIPNKNLQREITIYFKKNKSDVVTIKELNGTLIIGIILLILGVLGIIL